jgi:hypothetical protein
MEVQKNPLDPYNWILSFRDHWASYHHHKEQSALAGLGLYMAGAVALATAANIVRWEESTSIIIVAVCAIVIILFVLWQLANQRFASELVTGCDKLIYEWMKTPPSQADAFELISYQVRIWPWPIPIKKIYPKLLVDQLKMKRTMWLELPTLGILMTMVFIGLLGIATLWL